MNHQDPKLLRVIGSRVQPHFGWDLFLLGNIGETLLKASSRQLYVYAVAYLSHILHVVGVCSEHSVHLSSRVLMFSMPRYHQMKPQYYLVCQTLLFFLVQLGIFETNTRLGDLGKKKRLFSCSVSRLSIH